MKKRLSFLIQLRASRGWYQKDVVVALREHFGIHISESYYGMIEQGSRTPKLRLALAISQLFEVEPQDIFFEREHNKTLGKVNTA